MQTKLLSSVWFIAVLALFVLSAQTTNSVMAEPVSSEMAGGEVTRLIQSAIASVDAATVEASGLVWDVSAGRYLLISDETLNKNPIVYEVDTLGNIVAILPIQGAGDIDEMESISASGGYIYIASSLQRSRRGKIRPQRCKFVRLVRENGALVEKGQFDLYTLLSNAARHATDRETRHYLRRAINEQRLEIEAHAVVDGKLFLGLKEPFDSEGRSIILDAGQLESLFEAGGESVAIWQRVALRDPTTGEPATLSAMVWNDGSLLLLGVNQGGRRAASHLWRYQLDRRQLTHLKSYPYLHAEGLATSSNDGRNWTIVFDAGGNTPSSYTRTKIGD